jgi:molybdopterin synthase sulfur carrier subunit
MKINLLLFGSLLDVTDGKAEFELKDMTDINAVEKTMLEAYPALAKYTFRIAVNQQMIKANQELNDNDVVAFLPPFAGG